MKRFVFPLAVCLCLLAVVSHQTTVAAKDTWVSVRTKNFFLVGNGSEKDVRRVGLKLEQFREVFTRLFPKMKTNTPVPSTVVVFKSASSYKPFKIRENNAGFFQAGPDVNYIALTTQVGRQQDPFSIIFHEYTHLLVKNTFPNAPLWFNEGLAEYFSTFSIIDDQKFVLGTPIATHVFLLREKKMLPLRTLFEVDYKSPHYNETNKQSIFYAQSWALIHYLIIGKAGRAEQLRKFLDINRKEPMDEAFQQTFGMPVEAMEKDLHDYVRQDRYNVFRGHFERKIELDTAIEAKTLSEAEAQAYLGDLLLHSQRPEEAYTYLQKAVQLDPNLAMAHASLGMAYFRGGKVKEAHASLERAVAANSQNYLAHYYYAFTLSRSGFDDAPSIAHYSPEVATKVREHLLKAIALRPDYPESYNLLAYVSLVTGKHIDEAIAALKLALSSSPGQHDFMYMLGQLYLHKDDFKAAREMLEQVTKSNAEEQARRHSEALLTQLRSIEEQRARYKTAPASGSTSVDSDPDDQTTNEAARDPSFYLREALRSPTAGEIQLQATLVKIECEAKGIVFVVKTSAGLLRLRTASFNNMILKTYDPMVNGEITCGARTPENVVIACYVPNTDKRVKANGILKSIEFVPADFKLKP